MAETGSQQPKKAKAPRPQAEAPRKPLQVLHISRREEKEKLDASDSISTSDDLKKAKQGQSNLNPGISQDKSINAPGPQNPILDKGFLSREGLEDLEGISMADLLGPNSLNPRKSRNEITKVNVSRTVDDFDFDEEAFLAALDQNEPVGTTGEVINGKVITTESDGVYVDIGGKAPGFMPKNECGLGVITNLKERFPKGLGVQVLVTREQNADGIVTISCRALALRKSWEKVKDLEKDGKVVKVQINGFNRGGVTCDLEGLRGFIPRSQLEEGNEHEKLVGKTLGVAFLEVNSETRKLVLSEKRAKIATRFSELEVGQLVEGKVVAIKPYGFFVDIGGVSGLLHQSMITGGSLRSLREAFDQGETLKALITELDARRGRIGLNTALLENQPGELLIEKNKVMTEAIERAQKARSLLHKNDTPNDDPSN